MLGIIIILLIGLVLRFSFILCLTFNKHWFYQTKYVVQQRKVEVMCKIYLLNCHCELHMLSQVPDASMQKVTVL